MDDFPTPDSPDNVTVQHPDLLPPEEISNCLRVMTDSTSGRFQARPQRAAAGSGFFSSIPRGGRTDGRINKSKAGRGGRRVVKPHFSAPRQRSRGVFVRFRRAFWTCAVAVAFNGPVLRSAIRPAPALCGPRRASAAISPVPRRSGRHTATPAAAMVSISTPAVDQQRCPAGLRHHCHRGRRRRHPRPAARSCRAPPPGGQQHAGRSSKVFMVGRQLRISKIYRKIYRNPAWRIGLVPVPRYQESHRGYDRAAS